MARSIFAGIAGFVTAAVVITVVETVNGKIFPSRTREAGRGGHGSRSRASDLGKSAAQRVPGRAVRLVIGQLRRRLGCRLDWSPVCGEARADPGRPGDVGLHCEQLDGSSSAVVLDSIARHLPSRGVRRRPTGAGACGSAGRGRAVKLTNRTSCWALIENPSKKGQRA